jgi:hypothetical protein
LAAAPEEKWGERRMNWEGDEEGNTRVAQARPARQQWMEDTAASAACNAAWNRTPRERREA